MPHVYDDWQTVLGAHGNPPERPDVELRGGRLGAGEVSVTVAVREEAAGPVEFGDNLYGATVWAADGANRWRRVDTAEMRLMIAPLLQPGDATQISLPLAGSPEPVRVLVGGTWVDVSR